MSDKIFNSSEMPLSKVVDVDLTDITRNRFLNYAVSVITSRALPDVRDGLKPVQRRILYCMHHDLHLSPEKSTLKCAKVVGSVLGNYHPHGDSAVYEALVRMAQPWSLRYPLIHGQGNFGSLDGDNAAAYRYTEARLTPLAMEFVNELGQETVDFRRTFDDSTEEPVVLPARVPQLLINGCTGIAVGVATNIPPHNLAEVISACQALIDNRELTVSQLMEHIQGPDFPTGGEVLENRESLEAVYAEGHGRIRVRAQYKREDEPRRGPQVVITSIPYMVNKATLIEEIAELIVARKVPQLSDVRDESTDEVRIVLEIRKDADVETVMAYLYKNTALQTSFHVNMTCLVPDEDGQGRPARLGLKDVLGHYVDFRFQVTVRRLSYEVRVLKARLHVLEGFVKVFDALDEALDIIRNAEGRADAQGKLIARFELDELQADAVLDLRLYKLGRPDILAIRKEQLEKSEERDHLERMLANPKRLWGLVHSELSEIKKKYGDPRRTAILAEGASEIEYSQQAFIVAEEAIVVLSRDGWVRRITAATDLNKLRLRTDDEQQAILRGSTLTTVTFLSNKGTAYTIRFHDLPISSRGFGDPIQKLFNFSDGERVVAAFSLDPTVHPGLTAAGEEEPELHALAVGTDGRGLRFSLAPYLEPSTRSGRKYARPADTIFWVGLTRSKTVPEGETAEPGEVLTVVTLLGRALMTPAHEVNFLSGPGKGVTVIKLSEGDRPIGVTLDPEGLTVVRTDGGKPIEVKPGRKDLNPRGGRGTVLSKRGQLMLVPREPKAIESGERPSTPSGERRASAERPPSREPELSEDDDDSEERPPRRGGIPEFD